MTLQYWRFLGYLKILELQFPITQWVSAVVELVKGGNHHLTSSLRLPQTTVRQEMIVIIFLSRKTMKVTAWYNINTQSHLTQYYLLLTYMAKFWSGKNGEFDEYKAICQVLPANLFRTIITSTGRSFTHILSSNQFR